MPLLMTNHSDQDLLDLIAGIANNADLDEHKGDWTERAETILFIATRGSQGRDWGVRPVALSKEGRLQRHMTASIYEGGHGWDEAPEEEDVEETHAQEHHPSFALRPAHDHREGNPGE